MAKKQTTKQTTKNATVEKMGRGTLITPPNASKELPLSYYDTRRVKRSSVKANSEIPDL